MVSYIMVLVINMILHSHALLSELCIKLEAIISLHSKKGDKKKALNKQMISVIKNQN